MLSTTGSMVGSDTLPSTRIMRSTVHPPAGAASSTVGAVVPFPMGTPDCRGAGAGADWASNSDASKGSAATGHLRAMRRAHDTQSEPVACGLPERGQERGGPRQLED